MTKNIGKPVSLTSYLITLPPASHLVAGVIVTGTVFGLIVNLTSTEPLGSAITNGLLLLAMPALLSSIAIKMMAWKQPYRRIAATSFGGGIIYAAAYTANQLLFGISHFWSEAALLIGSAFVFVFWWAIVRYVFILRYRSVIFAAFQLLVYLAFLLTSQALHVPQGQFLDVAMKFYVSSFVMLAAAGIFIYMVNAPGKKIFDIKSTDVLGYFLNQWFYGTKELERDLRRLGEPVKTLVSVMGFKRKEDTVFFVTPFVHFGPFGNLGGSEFSHMLAKEIDRKHGSRTFVFHGTAAHDLNPVSSSEITKIVGSVESAIAEAKYKDATVSISTGRLEECKAQALRINDSAMIGLSRAPETTEDISLGLGLTMLFHAEKDVENVMIVDQHNAETGEFALFDAGSPVGFRYLGAISDALSKKSRKTPLRLGVASRQLNSPAVGQAGLKVAVFSTSPYYVGILIDSNGVVPEFRDRIESDIKKLGQGIGRKFVVGVYTTDTHEVNLKRGIVNPLKDDRAVLSAINEACREALSDMQEATFFADRKWLEINVLGTMRMVEIIATANSVVAMAKAALPFISIGAVLLILAIAAKL